MAGMNEHYHLSMKKELKEKLQERANKEGLFLSELIRKIIDESVRKMDIRDILKGIEIKIDKILKKI